MDTLTNNYNVLFVFLTSLIVCVLGIPSIVRIAEVKHLYDEPHGRKSHSTNIPTLGGIAIFAGLIFGLSFWTRPDDFFYMKYILSSVILIFFTGIKDDIINLTAWKKLLAQLVAAFILVYWGNVRISSLYGLMGVYELPTWLGISLSILTITLITNSFNLIDGVNWLAGGLGAVTSLTFGTWFLITNHNSYAVLAFALTGSLFGFLWYNKTPAKIFMGDTGSLLLGLISSVLAIKFIEVNKTYGGPYHVTSVPAVAISILIVPLFDTLRVMTIRILNGKSPLEADRNHLHHKLLSYGFSHMQVSFCLISFNLLYIAMGFLLMSLKGEFLLLIEVFVAVTFSWFLAKYARKKGGRIIRTKYNFEKEEVIH